MYKILLGIPAISSEIIEDKIVEEDMDPWCDFALCYDEDKNYYYFEFETYLAFPEGGARRWIEHCEHQLRTYMENHRYNTGIELNLYDVFTTGVNVNTHFETIEEAYAFMKLMVNGFRGKGLNI